MHTKEAISKKLGISLATVNNWIKTGMIPFYPNGSYYDDKTFEDIISEISNNHKRLKSRANRSKNVSDGTKSSTIQNFQNNELIKNISIIYKASETELNKFIFYLCLSALYQNHLITINDGRVECEGRYFNDFLLNWGGLKDLPLDLQLFDQLNSFKLPDNEVDFPGSVYEYVRTINDKSRFGAFFTPSYLTNDVKIPDDATILDPCSGTGTMILGMISAQQNPKNITLRDIDELALKIALVNFVLFFRNTSSLINIEIKDILYDRKQAGTKGLSSSGAYEDVYDYVITNPPYGAKLPDSEKKNIINLYPRLQTTETFSIALFNCLGKLKPDGKLIFILPESLLYIDAHLNIRKLIFESDINCKITHFGNAFNGVMSKIIRLDLIKENINRDLKVNTGKLLWRIPSKLLLKNDYRPPFIEDICESEILLKCLDADSFTLSGKCTFGLGIVTGNNELHLKETATTKTAEPIYTGKEIKKFKFDSPRYFIEFNPEILQQTAPVEYYRVPKICYKFISDTITTVADFNGCLVLNSANFLIPDSPVSLKALSAFLNSPLITFMYRRLFHSSKVLRKHFESIPVPFSFYESIHELEEFYNLATKNFNIWMDLNHFVCKMYDLNEQHTNHVFHSITK